ncbi:MAG: hypothetical protein OZ948_05440 [Deltaproteobacteria bacterium]|nr:hypothetical protein [Deltaproteobacteria bacterium]
MQGQAGLWSGGRGAARLLVGLFLAAGLVARALEAGAVEPWDVAPVVPDAAQPPLVCPGGGNGTDVADALLVLRRAVGLVSGFACDGVTIGDEGVDVAPPAAFDASADPPLFVAGGEGVVDASDALVLLRASLGLVRITAAPDLHFEGGLFAADFPLLAGIGSTLLAQAVSRNAASGPALLCAYPTDPLAVPAPAPLACSPLEGFAAGESRQVGVDLTVPADTGFRSFWLVLDDGDQIPESDEGNNVLAGSLLVAPPPPPQPDLVFPTFGAIGVRPPVPLPGEPFTLEVTIRNQGTAPVQVPFALDVFFDPPVPPEPGACAPLFSQVETPVPGGGEIVVSLPTGLGSGVAPGPHVLWATVDGGLETCGPPVAIGDVAEINESNNVSPPLPLCIGSGPAEPGDLVDLRADAIVPSFAGSSFRVSAGFSNAGTRDVVPFAGGFPQPAAFARLRISVFGAQPQELSSDLPCFVVGAQGFLESDLLPLLAMPARIELDLDPDHQIPELDDTNNRRCIQVNLDRSIDPC